MNLTVLGEIIIFRYCIYILDMPEVEVIKKYGIYVEKNNIIYTGTNLGYCYNAGYDKYVKTDTSSIHKEYIIDILRILGSIKENNCQITNHVCLIFR